MFQKPIKQTTIDRQLQTSLMEQTYYVFQDLENVLGILAETNEVLKFFEDQPHHPMVIDAQNRLITQINLSNTIQFDQSFVKDLRLKQNLKDLKSEARGYFEQIRKKMPLVDKIDHLADHYVKKNLSDNITITQLDTLKSQVTVPFNQQTVQKVINGMNQVDSIMEEIRSGKKIQIPTKEQFFRKMQERQQSAKFKLNQNFNEKQENQYRQEQNNNYSNLGQCPKNYSNQQAVNDQHNQQYFNNIPIINASNSQTNYSHQVKGDDNYKKKLSKNDHNTLLDDKKKNMEEEFQDPVNYEKKDIIYYLKKLHEQIALKDKHNGEQFQKIIEEIRIQVPQQALDFFDQLKKQLKSSEITKLLNLIIWKINSSYQQKIDISQIYMNKFPKEEIKVMKQCIEYLERNSTY